MPRAKTSIAGLIAIAASVLALASSAMAKEGQTKIVGGAQTTIQAYPYQVYLDITGRDGSYQCGGSIIDNTHIVTAAHCVVDDETKTVINPSYLSVGYGATETDDLTFIAVTEAEIYRAYPADESYDVARLTLASPIPFGPTAQPITIADAGVLDTAVDDGDTVTATGWGATSQGGSSSDTLKRVNLELREDAACIDYDAYIDARNLCVGGTILGRDTCQGDSGGPVALDGELVGVTSYGDGCAKPGVPGVYVEAPDSDVTALIGGTANAALVARGSEQPLYTQPAPVLPLPIVQSPPPAAAAVKPPAAVKDTIKPTLKLLKSGCKKGGRCSFRLAVADNSGDINETQFKVTRKVKKCKRVKGKRKCKKVTERAALKETNVKGGIEVSVKLKKGTWQLTAVVLDDADNKSVTVKKTIKVKG